MKHLTLAVIAFLLFVVSPFEGSGQISITTPDVSFSIKKGDSKDVTFTLASGGTTLAASQPTATCCGGAVSAVQKSATGNVVVLTFTGIRSLPQINDVRINFTVDGATPGHSDVKIAVIDPAAFAFDLNTITDAVQRTEKQVRMSVPGTIIEKDRVALEGAPALVPSYLNGIIKLKPNTKGKFNLIVKVDGHEVKTIPVDVAEGLQPLKATKRITLKQGDEININNLGIKLTGLDGTDLTATKCAAPTITPDPGDGIIETAAGSGKWKVNPAKRDDTGFTVFCGGESTRVDVGVEVKSGKIEFTPSMATLRRNSESVVSAQVFGIDGLEVEGEAANVTWKLNDNADGEFIEMIEEAGNRLRLRLRKLPTSTDSKQIVITAKSMDGFTQEFRAWTERTFEVTDFAMLKMYLEVVDPKTSGDNFGSQVTSHYFVTKVTLNNIVPDGNGTLFRAPILVYNQSIEAKVMFEYQDPDSGVWIAARREQKIPNVVRKEIPDPDILEDAKWKRVSDFMDTKPAGDYLVVPERRVNDLKRCEIVEQMDYIYPIQPLKYETILLTQESRENKKFKNRLLTALLGLSSLTSFVTNLVGAGGDWPGGQTQFNSLMIPAYQKFFPDRREIHKDHLIQEMMLPLVEIPFGSQETRYLLFPKSEIPVTIPLRRKLNDGTWANKTIKKIRITGISASDACANVAVIKKSP